MEYWTNGFPGCIKNMIIVKGGCENVRNQNNNANAYVSTGGLYV